MNGERIGDHVAFDYAENPWTDAKYEIIVLVGAMREIARAKPLRIKPANEYRLGYDLYSPYVIEDADAIIKIDIRGDGKHHCKVLKLNPTAKDKVKKWLIEHEHLCYNLASQLK